MWYSARLVFESEVSGGDDSRPLREEAIKLLQAESEEGAREKAEQLGHKDRTDYLNSDGMTVRWRFIEVIEVQDLCESELYDGVEVYSRLSWKE